MKDPFSETMINEDWETKANRTLHEAMINERSKRWTKVVNDYQSLLKMLYEVIPTDDKERPAWLTLLLYESHYHLAVALQKLGQQKKAIDEFTRAIGSVFIARNGCMVTRCRIASCLMTPIYARRAFAHAHAGDLKNATLDADKAVVFDSTNPDVYCVRALVSNTNNKTSLAAEDLKKALKLNQNHVCALILQGNLKKKNQAESVNYSNNVRTPTTPEEHLKAAKLNPDSYHYLTVDNFRHNQIVEFYDRFLYSLNVPHTISCVLTFAIDESPEVIAEPKMNEKTLPRSLSLSSLSHSVSGFSRIPSTSTTDDALLTDRSTSATFRSQASSRQEKERRSKANDHNMKRKAHYTDELTPQSSLDRRKAYGQAVNSVNAKAANQSKFIPVAQPANNSRTLDEQSLTSKPQMLRTPSGIQVFMEVNVSHAPRLYHRPWIGDRMPPAEVDRKQSIFPPFKV